MWRTPEPTSARLAADGSVQVLWPAQSALVSLDGQPLRAFELAGEDGKPIVGGASIVGDSIVLRAEGVAAPRYLRYAQSPWPDANLGGANHLAVAPFVLSVGAR